MAKRSVFYKYPRLYVWGLKWIHKNNFNKRYHYMADFVKKGDAVLEPGCGPAILADYLPESADYLGFDTNREFLSYALKKHSGVYLGNALDKKSYIQADVVIACDILHHLHPSNRKVFIKYCFDSAKRVFILCDPWIKDATSNGFIYSLKKNLVEWSEQDGTGNLKIDHYLSHKQLLNQIKQGFDVIPSSSKREIKKLGNNIIAAFFKSNSK
jgi:hypothetical protein